jgi:hypothetical protein
MRVRWRVLIALVACLSLSTGCREDNPVLEGPPPETTTTGPATTTSY